MRHGEYVDAQPGHWLTWHGRGLYGRHRYACGEHRMELKAVLREHWTEKARRLARAGGSPFAAPGS